MTAELISVGTELLMGNILNSNGQFLAEKCASLGFDMYYQITVGDNHGRLKEVLETALDRSDLVILTGGLGPTQDDLTKEVCAETMGMKLVEHGSSREHLRRSFENSLYGEIPENNWKMAMVPEGALVLENKNGMAPGLILEKEGKTVILLPGPPGELCPMFESQVMPYLKSRQDHVLISRMVKICDSEESQVEDQILDLIHSQKNPTIATYAKLSQVDIRITARGRDEAEAERLIEPVLHEILERFGNSVFTVEEHTTLEKTVIQSLKQRGLTISTAESCTGGLVASRLINVSGASEVFLEGLVTYSNQAKIRLLGVKKETLNTYGAVSRETAREMAEGGAANSGADVCVAITGLAGPGGGTDRKPVGLVFIACCLRGKTEILKYHFKGNREQIRVKSMMKALDLVRLCVLAYN